LDVGSESLQRLACKLGSTVGGLQDVRGVNTSAGTKRPRRVLADSWATHRRIAPSVTEIGCEQITAVVSASFKEVQLLEHICAAVGASVELAILHARAIDHVLLSYCPLERGRKHSYPTSRWGSFLEAAREALRLRLDQQHRSGLESSRGRFSGVTSIRRIKPQYDSLVELLNAPESVV
jgi:hypothetical protein